MSDEAALLAAILAHPDEDTPRLMFADWLQENGQPERAEFIRIQCAPDADEAAEERAAELEERNRAKWLAGLPQFVGAHWEFRRGFPEYLVCDCDQFVKRYEAFIRVSWLRFISLHQVDDSSLRDFTNRVWPSQWVELELHSLEGIFLNDFYIDTLGALLLSNCPQTQQLRRLQLSQFNLTAGAIEALAASPNFDNLRTLHIDDIGDTPSLAPLRERFGDRLVIG